jgi:hypothetical protein
MIILYKQYKMIDTELIISVNIHENINFMMKQLENIRKFVICEYIVVINANYQMYHVLTTTQHIVNDKNIVINPEHINKRRFHGSLTRGICSNMG